MRLFVAVSSGRVDRDSNLPKEMQGYLEHLAFTLQEVFPEMQAGEISLLHGSSQGEMATARTLSAGLGNVTGTMFPCITREINRREFPETMSLIENIGEYYDVVVVVAQGIMADALAATYGSLELNFAGLMPQHINPGSALILDCQVGSIMHAY